MPRRAGRAPAPRTASSKSGATGKPRRGDASPPRSRAQVVDEVLFAGRTLSTAAVMFHTALAALQGLGASDSKSLDLIDRFGPLTAGELATRSGLAPASVTGLLDRLEQRGMIRRARDPADGRRVLIELDRERMAALQPLFAEFVVDLQRLAAAFTTDELEVVLRFLRQATAVQEAATTRLAERSEHGPEQPRRARRR